MKRFVPILWVMQFLCITAIAQKGPINKTTISGIVKESGTGKTIEYATVAAFSDSLKPINAVAAGADGKFSLELPSPGRYIISASMVGYTNSKNEIILKDGEKRLDIGTLELTEGAQLKEITVVGVVPLIKAEPDKLTYNLDSDPQTSTSTVAEILRKVPMITIDGDDNVRLNGETNYKVFVNGRASGVMVRNFKDAIKAMPASSIKSIEVITNPPAKYDAEGIGGIINIITNRKAIEGYNGSINTGMNSQGGFNAGGYISAQIGKFAISTNLYSGRSMSRKNSNRIETENFISQEFRNSITEGNNNSEHSYFSGNIEASYEIDSLNLITLSGGGLFGSAESRSSSLFNSYNINSIATRSYSNKSVSNNGFGSGSGSLSYQRSYKKPDKNLTFSYSLDYNPMESEVESTIIPYLNYFGFTQHSKNRALGREHTLQADYYDPITKNHQIESGVKYILRQNTSDTKIRRLDDSWRWQDDPSKVNDLDYDQHIVSLYGGYAFKHKKMTAKAGFRVEYTINDGLSKSFEEEVTFTNKQFDIVPYVTFSWMLNKGKMISASFTQRLSRPGIWYLNPYVNDSDPMNISYGNPNLETVKRNTANIAYRKNAQSWNLSVNMAGSMTRNNIERITRISSLGVSESTYENIGKNDNLRLNVNFSFRAGQKLNLNLNGAAFYTNVRSDAHNLENDGFSFNGGFGGNAVMWKGSRVSFNAFVHGGEVSLQSKTPILVFTSFSLSQRLLKDKLTLSIGVVEPFRDKKIMDYKSFDNTYSIKARNEIQMRSVQFGLFWRFGNYNPIIKRARRSTTDDKMSGGGTSATPATP